MSYLGQFRLYGVLGYSFLVNYTTFKISSYANYKKTDIFVSKKVNFTAAHLPIFSKN